MNIKLNIDKEEVGYIIQSLNSLVREFEFAYRGSDTWQSLQRNEDKYRKARALVNYIRSEAEKKFEEEKKGGEA